MDSIFNEVCILVTAAFALTLVPGFRRPERSLLSGRDQGTALLVFLILGLVEEATVSHAGWLNVPHAIWASASATRTLPLITAVWRGSKDSPLNSV